MKKLFFVIPFLVLITNITAQTTENKEKETGYFNLTSVGIIVGSPEEYFETNAVIPSFNMVNGYYFNKHFTAGVGVGAEIYRYTVFPVFADFRYIFTHSGYHPYVAVKGGYSFAKSSKVLLNNNYYSYDTYNNTGGWMANPEIGIFLKIGQNIGLTIGLGYRFQQLESEITSRLYGGELSDTVDNFTTDNITTTFNRLSFNVGFSFR